MSNDKRRKRGIKKRTKGDKGHTFDGVTRLRQAEKRIRRLAAVVKDSNDPVVLFDLEGHIEEWNRGAAAMYGWSEEEALRMNIRDLAPAEETAGFEERIGRVLAGQTVGSFETRRHTKDGRVLDVWLTITAVTDESGKVSAVATTERDITERTRIEELLRQSEERYRNLFETMTEGFSLDEIICDEAGRPVDLRYLAVNPAFERHTGLKAAQVVGRTARELFPDSEPLWFERYGKVALTGEPAQFEASFGPLGRWFDVSAFRTGPGRFAVVFTDITYRKQVEEALQTNLQRFYTILASMYPDVLLVADDGKVEFANQAFCDGFCLKDAPEDLMGLASGEMIEKIRNLYLHPDEAVARIQEIVKQGQPVKGEEVAMRDGRTCLRDFVPVKVNGKSYGRMWVHIDITERKRMEESVRRAKEEWERTFDSVPDLIVILDEDHRVVRANRAMAQKLGVTPEQCVGMPCYKAVHGTDTPPDFCPHSRTLADRQAHTVEVHEERLGGDFIVTTTPMFDPDGKMTGTVHVARDITERKRAEEAMLQSEARFGGIVNSAMDAIVSIDAEQRIVQFNAAAESMFGYAAREMIGQPVGLLMPPDRRAAHEQHVRTFAATGVTSRRMGELGELAGLRANGEPFPIEASISQIEVAGRKVLTVILRDITARKAAQEALAEAARDLENSNEDLRQFAEIASHDLQEPLRMVSGFLKILDDRYKPQLDDKAREYIGFAVEGATRMSYLIRDLLEYSRVERRGQKPQQTEARKSLGGALANLQRSIKDAGAAVTYDDLPSVLADPTQLMQIFQNLIGNAIKFHSPQRPCHIHVGAENRDGRWVFQVRDNGIGIAPEQFARIFVIFQRLHTRDKYPGTGIGLAICKKIVERHGGKIWVESKVGEGSTFYFAL